MTTLAPAPSRSTAQIILTFGMLPIPIRLFTSTQDVEGVKRTTFAPSGNQIKAPYVDEITREEVPRSECIKKVPVGDGYVELSDEEISVVTSDLAVNKGSVPILTFIPVEELGFRYRIKSTLQARPQMLKVGKTNKPNPQADKLFVVLTTILERNNAAALVRVGLRGPARYGALTSDGMFHFLYFDSEVREQYTLPEAEVADSELELAGNLFDAIGIDTPDLVDEASEKILAYIAEKSQGGEVATMPAEPVEDSSSLDLTAMLAASVQATKANA